MIRMFALGLLTLGLPLSAGAAPDGIELIPAPAEASSALFRGWNKPKGDHHPMFALDGSKKTGWVEGAEGDGVGEWIRLHVSPTDSVEQVTLKLRNGCQATGKSYKAFARLASATVTLLPRGKPQTIEIADTKKWQTFTIDGPAGRLEAVELRIEGVHRGGGGEHACLGDARVFVHQGAAVDAAAQKARKKAVRGWVKARRKIGRAMGSRKARNTLPFAPRYIARSDGQDIALDCGVDQICFIEEGLKALRAALGDEAPPEVTRALEVMADDAGWRAVELTVDDGRPVPPVDGLCSDDGIDTWPCAQGVYLPPRLGYLTRQGLKAKPIKVIPTLRQLGDPGTCSTYGIERIVYARPSPGVPSAVVQVECAKGEAGEPDRNAMQLLVYDRVGRLSVSASPREVAALWWTADTAKRPAVLKKARTLVLGTGMRTIIEPETPLVE